MSQGKIKDASYRELLCSLRVLRKDSARQRCRSGSRKSTSYTTSSFRLCLLTKFAVHSKSTFVTAPFLPLSSGDSSLSSHAPSSRCTASRFCNRSILPLKVQDILLPVGTPVPPYIWLPTPHTVTHPFLLVPTGDNGQRQDCS